MFDFILPLTSSFVNLLINKKIVKYCYNAPAKLNAFCCAVVSVAFNLNFCSESFYYTSYVAVMRN